MITIFTLFLVGFQLGATACALSCLPIVTPILISNSNYTNNKSFYILIQYFGGKLLAYTSISILAFFSSQFIKNSLTSEIPFTQIGASAIILVSVLLLYRAFKSDNHCKTSCNTQLKYGYFTIGVLSSFNFCLPVATLIATSAISESLILSLFYGVSFGFGVIFIPFLFLYFVINKVSHNLIQGVQANKRKIEITSASFLLIIGFLVFFEILKL